MGCCVRKSDHYTNHSYQVTIGMAENTVKDFLVYLGA
jgi:hypothetical protein